MPSISDISVDSNFHDRGYVEDSGQEDSKSLLKGEFGKVVTSGTIKNAKTVEVQTNDEEDVELWLPPEPENQDEDVISSLANYDDDDDECGDGVAWAKPSSLSSFGEQGSGSFKFNDKKLKAMDNVRNGKFKALVCQLVKSVGVDGENWVDIVTSLSWEAAVFVKPDTNEGKAMDPDGYVKVKCIATGLRTQSRLIKGLVFKKHAAHKHMPTKYKNPRLLLIHGSLDLSSGGLSSFESMQQEKDNLKSIVEMIEMYHANAILVEKSVSRDIQESILAKGMTLVFDMKLHRLERVACCIGSPVFSKEVAIRQTLRQCDLFHIEKFVEEHDISTECGKKLRKTLMFIEGCPSRLGCTIMLMGANSDELKRIKCVVRRTVVMAYHLIMETCFLLDKSAMLSTISLGEAQLMWIGTDESNIFSQNESDDETITSFETNTSISNGFHQNEPENLLLSSEGDSLNRFVDEDFLNGEQPYHPGFLDMWKKSDSTKDQKLSKDAISAVLDSESILVLTSIRNASRGTICEQSHFSHIKFYRSFDVPLGKFLHDNLLNQRQQCQTCGETPEMHIYYHAHHDKQLTIQVRHLRKNLPGETEGKLWMWGRCGQCKLGDGSSKSTKRVVISTAARCLSFGKFLELGFSNHSSFSSLSSCGHSFQKDFIYFFGLGPMVAMFKYSPVATHSVSLPPQELEFNASVCGEFLQTEYENVYLKGMSMFLDIEKLLKNVETRFVGATLNIRGSNTGFSDIRLMLKQERSQFEVDIQKAIKHENEDDAVCKLLSLNRIQLELLLESCIWDRRLHALLSSDLKPVDAYAIGPQAQGHLLNDNENAQQEFNEANIATSVEADDIPVKEIQIDEFLVGPSPDTNDLLDKTTPFVNDIESAGFDSNHDVRKHEKDWIWAPFADIVQEYMEDLQRGYLPKIESFNSYSSESMAQKLIINEGSKLHIPLGTNDYVVSDYEDEYSSIIACALTLLKDVAISIEDLTQTDSGSNGLTRVFSFKAPHWSSSGSSDSDGVHSPHTSLESSHSSSFDGLDVLDPLVSNTPSHPEVSMGSVRYSAKRKYSVVCLFGSQFRELRDRFCPEMYYIASLSRCRNWDAKGGKSKSLFAKTLDDRFIVKEIKRTEFDSFVKFATNYFEYMEQCYKLRNQTCLAKILGIYQVTVRTRSGKETRRDLLVMENLSFGRHIARQYDLKGALHARLNTAGNNSGDVLLDQNFVNDMNVSPLYVSRKSKRNLQRAVYNDTNFLNSINVMDYSLLVGVDAQRSELSCGIIDYLRQYTWDKQLENWVKSSLVVPKNQLPTIISPKEYKKRFRKFIDTHFLSVPDHWCSQRSSRHDAGSLKSPNHGKQNGFSA